MTSPKCRRELRAEYRQRPSDAGVHALRNMATGRVLVASTTDLAVQLSSRSSLRAASVSNGGCRNASSSFPSQVLAATLFGDDPAGLGGDVTAALGGDAAAGC